MVVTSRNTNKFISIGLHPEGIHAQLSYKVFRDKNKKGLKG